MSFFSFTKSENRRVEQVLPGGGRLVALGVGRMWGKDMGGLILCKYCVHMYINGKMIPVETIPGMGGRGKKENVEGLNSTIPTHHNNKKIHILINELRQILQNLRSL
jgi:hypothetical protein